MAFATTIIAQQRGQGRMPVDNEEYSVSGCNHCYATIWVKNLDYLGWQIWYGMSSAGFSSKVLELRNNHRLVAVNGTVHIDHDFLDPDDVYNRYSGIWLSDHRNRGTFERRDMDSTELAQFRSAYEQAGYRPLAFESYPVEKSCTVIGGCVLTTNYAVVARQNT